MGMADIAEVLWRAHLRHNPVDPQWINRDRFVLSNGHGSRRFFKDATEAAKEICQLRFDAFGCSGHASKIKVISLDQMAAECAR